MHCAMSTSKCDEDAMLQMASSTLSLKGPGDTMHSQEKASLSSTDVL